VRWSEAVSAIEEMMRLGERRCRKLLLRTRCERGVWGSLTGEEDQERFYKVDKTEDGARRRRRMRHNYGFDSHEEASAEARGNTEAADLFKLTTMDRTTASASVVDQHGDDKVDEQQDRLTRIRKSSIGAALARRLLFTQPQPSQVIELAAARLRASQVAGSGALADPLILATHCVLVRQLRLIAGTLALSRSALYFFPTSEHLLDGAKERRWDLSRLTEVLSRRYLLQLRALELFFAAGGGFSSVFFSFDSVEDRQETQRTILSQHLPALLAHHNKKVDANVMQRPDISAWTRAWQMGALSNFDYLMRLNSFAGRTYSDLTQYPVMPWVLCDFKSSTIDLRDPAVYRDLSRPMGALNPANRARLCEQFQVLKDTFEEVGDPQAAPPPFHYGSHYSSMGVVLFFLLRVEPFTTQALALQDGRFDHADRLFHSIEQTYEHIVETGNTSDVKELVPEAYYLPEFLRNRNGFNLGVRQDGERVDDVVLPPWANGSAHEFIRVQRAALESDHVSAHLNEWIDLIFGARQLGESAQEALNVFYHLTYEGAVDMGSLQGHEREVVVHQIREFGQTPSRLFTSPHPRRGTLTIPRAVSTGVMHDPSSQVQAAPAGKAVLHVWLVAADNRLLVLDSSLTLRWFPLQRGDRAALRATSGETEAKNADASTSAVRPPLTLSIGQSVSSMQLRWRAARAPALRQWCTVGADGDWLFVCGNWAQGLHMHTGIGQAAGRGIGAWNSGSTQAAPAPQALYPSFAQVTCVAISSNSASIIAGLSDGSACIWSGAPPQLSLRMAGHNAAVSCAAIQNEIALAVTGSEDGTAICYDVHSGAYMRTLQHPNGCTIHAICLGGEGNICMYSSEDRQLHLYSINGEHLVSLTMRLWDPAQGGRASVRALHMTQSSSPGFVVVFEDGGFTFRRSHDLSLCCAIKSAISGAISSAVVREAGGEQYEVIVGFETGKVATWIVDLRDKSVDCSATKQQ